MKNIFSLGTYNIQILQAQLSPYVDEYQHIFCDPTYHIAAKVRKEKDKFLNDELQESGEKSCVI